MVRFAPLTGMKVVQRWRQTRKNLWRISPRPTPTARTRTSVSASINSIPSVRGGDDADVPFGFPFLFAYYSVCCLLSNIDSRFRPPTCSLHIVSNMFAVRPPMLAAFCVFLLTSGTYSCFIDTSIILIFPPFILCLSFFCRIYHSPLLE